jgi:hypothetical protein
MIIMKKELLTKDILIWGSSVLLLIIIYVLFDIPSKEGFNPSDDGVILAQSYRILHGQIPHLEFISIRPVGSAVFHLLNYLSPLPLIISSRWFVLVEYYLIGLFLVLILRNLTRSSKFITWKNEYAILLTVFAFLMSQNHYNLYPWTTIDAVMWIMMALVGLSRLTRVDSERNRSWLSAVLVVGGSVFSALSRQTFALPALIMLVLWLVITLRSRQYLSLFVGIAVGLTPVLPYFILLTVNGGFDDFIQQMTGRTEFWETGVVTFWKSFWNSPFLLLYILILLAALYYQLSKNRDRKKHIYQNPVAIILCIPGFVMLLLSIAIYIWPEELFNLAFQMFFILLMIRLLIPLSGIKNNYLKHFVSLVLLVSWTSAISLGDNTPVFTLGLLSLTGVFSAFYFAGIKGVEKARISFPVLSGMVMVFLVFSLSSQVRVNYRDLPARELNRNLGEILPEFGAIRANDEIYDYYQDILRIYRKLDSPEGRFAVVPNNAVLYPILGSANPLPLDWMQQPEFVGSEQRLLEEMDSLLRQNDLFILVEKFNSKWLAYRREPLDSSSGYYPYLSLVYQQMEELEFESEYFRAFVCKGK